MVERNLDNEIVVLYDRLHKLYVDLIRFQDVCPTEQSVESIEKLYNVMNKVNDCMIQMTFGGMGAFVFLDVVNLNDLYSVVFTASLDIQNQRSNFKGPYADETVDSVRMYAELQTDFTKVYLAIQGVLQIFVSISNEC